MPSYGHYWQHCATLVIRYRAYVSKKPLTFRILLRLGWSSHSFSFLLGSLVILDPQYTTDDLATGHRTLLYMLSLCISSCAAFYGRYYGCCV